MLALGGVTLIETSEAVVTVMEAVPTFPEKSAETVVLPGARPETTPLLPFALLTVATAAEDEVQVATRVKSRVSLFANSPVAVKPALMLSGMLALLGLICIDVNAAPSTTTLAVALTDPDCTVMVAIPADCPVAIPELLTVATFVSEEDQVELPLTERLLPSLNVPIAL
jgi:hypothetical protein